MKPEIPSEKGWRPGSERTRREDAASGWGKSPESSYIRGLKKEIRAREENGTFFEGTEKNGGASARRHREVGQNPSTGLDISRHSDEDSVVRVQIEEDEEMTLTLIKKKPAKKPVVTKKPKAAKKKPAKKPVVTKTSKKAAAKKAAKKPANKGFCVNYDLDLMNLVDAKVKKEGTNRSRFLRALAAKATGYKPRKTG